MDVVNDELEEDKDVSNDGDDDDDHKDHWPLQHLHHWHQDYRYSSFAH